MSDEDALKDPNEEGITHEEQAARLAARHKRASFLGELYHHSVVKSSLPLTRCSPLHSTILEEIPLL